MNIALKKFGTILVARQNGREALAAAQPRLAAIEKQEQLIINFEGVITFSPSWGDEFLSPLLKKYGAQLVLKNTSNTSVKATLELLEQINKQSFVVRR